MSQDTTPGAHPQAGQAKKTASHRASSLSDAFARSVLDTIGQHKRSFPALHAQIVRVDKLLTRAELKSAVDYLHRNGLVEIEQHDGVAFIVPVQKLQAGRRSKGGAA